MLAKPSLQRLAPLALLLGLIVACGPVAVEVTPTTGTKKKAKARASASPPASARPVASASPSASPSASASPAATASPTASPSASPAATSSGSPSPSPSASAVPSGDWSGAISEADALAHIGFPFEPAGRTWTYEAELKAMGFPVKGTMVQTVKTVDAQAANLELAFDIIGKKETRTQDRPRTGTASSTTPIYTKERVTVPAGTFDAVLVEETLEGQPAKTWYDKVKGPVQATLEVPEVGPVTVKLKSDTPG